MARWARRRVVGTARQDVGFFCFMAVQGLCKQPCGGRLADAARTGEQIRMMQTVEFQGITQCLRNVFLPGDLFKGLRAPFSCDHLIGHFC